MSYSLNQNYNQYQNPTMGLNTQPLQNIDTQKLREDAKKQNNIVNNTINDHEDNQGVVAAVTVPVWVGICEIMKRFNKKCATTVVNGKETSMLHKIQDWANVKGKSFEASDFGKNFFKVTDGVSGFVKNKVIAKSKILDAIVNNPAQPVNSMAKMTKNGTLAETAQDAIEAFQRYAESAGGAKTAGYDISKIKKLGFSDLKSFEKFCEEPYTHVDDIIKKAEKLGKLTKDAPIEVAKKSYIPFTNIEIPVVQKILSRKVEPTEVANKLKSLSGKSLRGNEAEMSRLGKKLPKTYLRVAEGLTNGTAGGKIAIAMQAFAVADAIVRAAKAPKGEKGKTFSESMIYDLSYYLMMPLGMTLMYGAGGAKYIGMNKTQVEQYRKALKTFNENAIKGMSKADYKAGKKALNTMLAGSTKVVQGDGALKATGRAIKNIAYKPLKAFGKIFTTGLETIEPYMGKNKVLNTLKTPFKSLTCGIKKLAALLCGADTKNIKGISGKGLTGGALRFIAYMFVIAPPLAKAVTKLSHLVFGKPTKSILDEDKEETKSAEKPALVYPQDEQVVAQAPQIQQIQQTQKQNFAGFSNNLNKVPSEDDEKKPTRRYVPSSDSEIETEKPLKNQKSVTRNYIPSSQAADVSAEDPYNSKAQSIMAESEKAERLVNKCLRK